ncbi:MAG TPA: glycosyltransferase family 39 protein [Polyangia bacterium]|jgi:4-amino-4-deoxy-L-arabinose transferase-like glycosyltransferase|nr:glycosyltransferase family 39 protein [Polyangia bacterium]
MKARTRSALLLLAVCLGLRVLSLLRPCLSDDEATYCVVAREMLRGRVLYRDVVDHKPPLIYLTYAATQSVGGPEHGMLLLHLLTIAFVWATALLLGRIAARATDRGGDDVPFAAALLFIVFTTTLLDFDALAANCELYMLLPLTASVLLYLRGFAAARTSDLLGAGLLLGVAVLYKYQAAVHLPLYLCHLAIVHRRRAARLLWGWGTIGLGFVAPLIFALWAMKRAAALDAALFWFSFNAAYIRQGFRLSEVAARAVGRVSYGVIPALFIWILGVRAVALGWRRRREDPVGLFLIGWCAVSALAIMVGGRFFGHYFHQVTAPLTVLAAPEAARLWRSRRAFGLAAMGLPALVFLLIGLLRTPAAKAVGVGDPDYQAIARFVRAHSAPTDRLVVWGNVPVLYFETNLPLGSRFVFSNYLTGLSPATRTQFDPSADASANVVAESWEMFLADLLTRAPELFVDTSPGNLGAYGKFPLARFPRLQAIIDRNYSPIGEVAGTRIFVRR